VTFVWPIGLVALAAVPVALALYLLARRRRARYAVRFTNLEVLAAVAQKTPSWRRVVPPALFLAALAICAVALARPEVSTSAPRDKATVVLTIDTSGSMMADDVKPSRMVAAQEAVRAFLQTLPDRFQVAVVAFAGEAQVVAPPTGDRDLVRSALEYLLPDRGTAIGDAVALSVETGKAALGEGAVPPRVPSESPVAIVMLSDGYQTAGLLQPLEAAQRARAARIPVHTIALGTPSGQITFNYGGFERTIPVPPDPQTLSAIARATGGEFFAVHNAERLKRIYENLGSRVGRVPAKEEVTYAFAAGAAGLLVIAGALSGLWFGRLP
jgi:Ca-activated chloride channel family protein